MRRFLLATLVWCLVAMTLGAEDMRCLTQAQIDSKDYAVRITKEHGEFDEVFARVEKDYGLRDDKIGVFRVQENGHDFAIISFGQMSDIRQIDVHKNVHYESKATVYNDGKPTQEVSGGSHLSSKYIGGTLLRGFRQSDGLIQWVALIQFDAQKSEYVSPMLRFTFENGASISLIIDEYALESDIFYDKQRHLLRKCE